MWGCDIGFVYLQGDRLHRQLQSSPCKFKSLGDHCFWKKFLNLSAFSVLFSGEKQYRKHCATFMNRPRALRPTSLVPHPPSALPQTRLSTSPDSFNSILLSRAPALQSLIPSTPSSQGTFVPVLIPIPYEYSELLFKKSFDGDYNGLREILHYASPEVGEIDINKGARTVHEQTV